MRITPSTAFGYPHAFSAASVRFSPVRGISYMAVSFVDTGLRNGANGGISSAAHSTLTTAGPSMASAVRITGPKTSRSVTSIDVTSSAATHPQSGRLSTVRQAQPGYTIAEMRSCRPISALP